MNIIKSDSNMSDCGRYGCTEIMCKRLILCNFICEDCYKELCAYKDTWNLPMTSLEIKIKIEQFMKQ